MRELQVRTPRTHFWYTRLRQFSQALLRPHYRQNIFVLTRPRHVVQFSVLAIRKWQQTRNKLHFQSHLTPEFGTLHCSTAVFNRHNSSRIIHTRLKFCSKLEHVNPRLKRTPHVTPSYNCRSFVLPFYFIISSLLSHHSFITLHRPLSISFDQFYNQLTISR